MVEDQDRGIRSEGKTAREISYRISKILRF